MYTLESRRYILKQTSCEVVLNAMFRLLRLTEYWMQCDKDTGQELRNLNNGKVSDQQDDLQFTASGRLTSGECMKLNWLLCPIDCYG